MISIPLDIRGPAHLPQSTTKTRRVPNYLFMILTFPIYLPEQKEIISAEINFFIGPEFLITVNKDKLAPLEKFFEQCQLNDTLREKFMSGNPTKLLYEILNRLQDYCFPMLDHINEDIDVLEQGIFSGSERMMVEKILIIKRNIVNFRKIMQAHKNVLKKLISKNTKYFIPTSIESYYANILEQTKDIWDILNNQKETIDALHYTNESLISFRLNNIMKTLTIFSVIVFPLTLLAGIFGMNVTGSMPFLNNPHGFWVVIIVMLVGIVLMFFIFKKKKWL
jgi:magnesium transporter